MYRGRGGLWPLGLLLAALVLVAPGSTAISLEGTLVFVSSTGIDAAPDALVVDLEGTRTNLTRLRVPGSVRGVVVSPDEKGIVYVVHDRNQLSVWWARSDGSQARQLTQFTTTDDLGSLAWRPDGRRILVAASHLGRSSIRVLDPIGGTVVRLGEGSTPEWSPDGAVITFSRGNRLLGWAGGRVMWSRQHSGGGRPAWSPDGTMLAFSDSMRTVTLARMDGRLLRRIRGHEAIWSPDSRHIAIVADKTMSLLRADGVLLARRPGYPAAWSPSGDRLALVSPIPGYVTGEPDHSPGDYTFTIVDTKGRSLFRRKGLFVDWSPAGNKIISEVDGGLAIAAAGGRGPARQVSHPQWDDRIPPRIIWSSDGRRFLSRVGARAYVVDTLRARAGLLQTDGAVDGLEWTAAGLILVGEIGKVTRLVTFAASGAARRVLLTTEDGGRLDWYGLLPDDRIVYKLAPTDAPRLFVVSLSTGAAPRLLTQPEGGYLMPAWSPDGAWIAVPRQPRTSTLREIDLVDAATGDPRLLLGPAANLDGVDGVAWSPLGDQLAFVEEAENETTLVTARIDSSATTPLANLGSKAIAGSAVSWSPDGASLAFARIDGIYAVDVATRTERKLVGPTGAPTAWAASPAWSPDGTLIAFRARDGVYIADVATAATRIAGPQPRGRATDRLAWSPDGRWLAFAAADTSCADNLERRTIYVVPREGGDPARLPAIKPCFGARSPSWTATTK